MNTMRTKNSRIFQGLFIASLLSGCAEQDGEPDSKNVASKMSPEVEAVSRQAEVAALDQNPNMPSDLSAVSEVRLVTAYEQTQKACGEIQAVCVRNGEDAEKCVQIETACLEGSEAILRGEQTRAGLLSLLTELITDILGVGPLAVDLVRCVSRFLSCALTTLELTCAVDLVECVVDDVIL